MDLFKIQRKRLACLLLVAAFLPRFAVQAQVSWPPASDVPYLSLNYTLPFDGDYSARYRPLGGISINADVPLSPTTTLRVEVPISLSRDFDGSDWNHPQTSTGAALGNPYVGVSTGSAGNRVLEIGVRLPVTEWDTEHLSGLLVSHTVDRFGAWAPNSTVASFVAHPFIRLGERETLRFRAGAYTMIPVRKTSGADPQFYLTFGPRVEGHNGPLDFGFGAEFMTHISGRYGDDGSFNRRTYMQAFLAAEYRGGRVHPGIELKFPFGDNMRMLADFMLGFRLGFPLNK